VNTPGEIVPPVYGSLVGQDVLERILRRSLRRGQLAHAILLTGEAGQGMELAAWVLARALLCEAGGEAPCEACPGCAKTRLLDHPDLEIVLPLPPLGGGASSKDEEDSGDQAVKESAKLVTEALKDWREKPWQAPRIDKARQIQVAQVRLLKKWAGMRSYEGRGRVAIILEAERLGVQAQNALLKLLEEPPEELILLLCTRQPEALLPTILSRCQSLALRPAPVEALTEWVAARGLDRLAGLPARELAQQAGGNPGRAVLLAEEQAGQEGEALWRPETFVRDLLARDSDALYKRISAMDEARDRESLRRFLEDLQVWLMDTELVRLLGAEAGPRVINAGQLRNLEIFAERVRFPRLDRVLEGLSEAVRHCDRNVNTFILLLTLAQAMRRGSEALTRKQPA
jgi:DNA polymerase III subunit delta'